LTKQKCEFDADVAVLLCSHCLYWWSQIAGQLFFMHGSSFILKSTPPAVADSMSIEPKGLSSVVFCCTEIKQKTHETLQHITV